MSAVSLKSEILKSCQSCGHQDLQSALFLGYIPPSNTLPVVNTFAEELTYYPLQMLHCKSCELVQLSCQVPKEITFPADYPFLSRITKALRDNFQELANDVHTALPLTAATRVLDIGSNDGTLLNVFRERGCQVYGVEPTDTAKDAEAAGIPTLREFFNSSVASRIEREQGQFDVITLTNVLAHAEGLNDFVKGVRGLLSPKGVLAIEVHSLKSMMQNMQFDKITHEHQRYFSLRALNSLLQRFELTVTHARWIPSHGGSLRVFARPLGAQEPMDLSPMLAEEDQVLRGGAGLKEFSQQILQTKVQLQRVVGEIRARGERIYGVGAPSRAFALLEFNGLDHFFLDCVLEVSGSLKLGKYIPGTLIPIEDEAKLFTDQPEYAMMLSWHVAQEVMPKLRAKGFRGKFILPLPQPRVVENA
jgi:SAM-dependent methyltransferase